MLQVSLFGSVKVVHEGCRCEPRLTRTTQLLLAFLLLERHRLHSREVVASLFWGEGSQQHARKCLNTALWRLRQALRVEEHSPDAFLIASPGGEIGFNTESDYWLDVAVFDERLGPVLKKPAELVREEEVQQVEQALDLYTGELLEGVYEEWALRAREQKRILYLNGLFSLQQYYRRQGAWEKSLAFCQRILELDPLREEIHRELMRLYLATGQRAAAIRQYEVCRQSLGQELGIPPMEETQALYAYVLDQAGRRPPGPPAGEIPDLAEVLAYLQQAERNLALAQEQFQQAMHRLEPFLPPGRKIEY